MNKIKFCSDIRAYLSAHNLSVHQLCLMTGITFNKFYRYLREADSSMNLNVLWTLWPLLYGKQTVTPLLKGSVPVNSYRQTVKKLNQKSEEVQQ